MKFYLTFVKLPHVYMVVDKPNKTQAIAPFAKYRNDIIATGDDPKFSFKEAISFRDKWKEVDEEFLKENCNTRKKFKLMFPSGSVSYTELRDDELQAQLKRDYPKGQFFSIQGERFFVIRKGKENVPICAIKEVRSIPKMLEDIKVVNNNAIKDVIEAETYE